LCDGAILLSKGEVRSQGTPKAVVDLYQALTHKMSDQGYLQPAVVQASDEDSDEAEILSNWTKATTVTSNQQADLLDFRFVDAQGQRVMQIESEQELTVRYKVRLKKDFDRPAFGLIIRDSIGRSVFETSTFAMGLFVAPIGAEKTVTVRFKMIFNIRAGQYSFSVGVSNRGYLRSEFEEITLLMHDVDQLQVLEAPSSIYYGGVFNMNPAVSLVVS
jgi:hypothetical protein